MLRASSPRGDLRASTATTWPMASRLLLAGSPFSLNDALLSKCTSTPFTQMEPNPVMVPTMPVPPIPPSSAGAPVPPTPPSLAGAPVPPMPPLSAGAPVPPIPPVATAPVPPMPPGSRQTGAALNEGEASSNGPQMKAKAHNKRVAVFMTNWPLSGRVLLADWVRCRNKGRW
ncbi:hypothetical protein D3C76_1003250 [compost metagenome]